MLYNLHVSARAYHRGNKRKTSTERIEISPVYKIKGI